MVRNVSRELLNFNIDRYVNPFILPNPTSAFPKPIAHFLGHRSQPSKDPPSVIDWILTAIATVAGICSVGAVFSYGPGVHQWNPPSIVASLGASAVLYYNTTKSPLGQPKNAVLGHFVAAIVGTGIAKAFQLHPTFFVKYSWVCAAVACAGASVAMSIVRAVHPPGGATAILACTEAEVIALGWRFPAIMLVASLVMLGVALLLDNIGRQYPVFWWTGEAVGSMLPLRRNKAQHEGESSAGAAEKGEAGSASEEEENIAEAAEGWEDEQIQEDRASNGDIWFREELDAIRIAPEGIMVPTHVELAQNEVEMLRSLMLRMQKRELDV